MAVIGGPSAKFRSRKLPVFGGAPAAAGGLVFTDNFDRANENLEASPNWTMQTGAAAAAAVASNALSLAGSGKTNPTIYTAPDTGSVDHFAEAVVNSTASLNSFHIAIRVNPNGDYIGARVRGASAYQVFQSVSGIATQLAAQGTATAGTVVRIAAAGNAVALFLNGAQAGSAATTTVTTGTRAGIIVRGENVTGLQDNWRSGAGSGA